MSGRSGVSPHSGDRYRLWQLVMVSGEVLGAAVLGWGAYACWNTAIGTVSARLADGTELVSRTYAGNWVGLAIGLGMLAAVLLIHAIHVSVQGTRTGDRRRRKVLR